MWPNGLKGKGMSSNAPTSFSGHCTHLGLKARQTEVSTVIWSAGGQDRICILSCVHNIATRNDSLIFTHYPTYRCTAFLLHGSWFLTHIDVTSHDIDRIELLWCRCFERTKKLHDIARHAIYTCAFLHMLVSGQFVDGMKTVYCFATTIKKMNHTFASTTISYLKSFEQSKTLTK